MGPNVTKNLFLQQRIPALKYTGSLQNHYQLDI